MTTQVTSTLTANSDPFVAAYEKANLALAKSRAALAEQKAAMMAAGTATDEMKAKQKELASAMAASQASFANAKAKVMEFGTAAEAAGGEHSGGGVHALARGMRFAAGATMALEGQVQHSGHAIVGIMAGLENPAMLLAMVFGTALDLVVKHFEKTKTTSQEVKDQIAENIADMASRGKASLQELVRAAKDAEKALLDVGLTTAEQRKLDAANKLGEVIDLQSRITSDLPGLMQQQTTLKTRLHDLGNYTIADATGSHADQAAIARDQLALQNTTATLQLEQTRAATIDQEVAAAQRAFVTANAADAAQREFDDHKRRALEVDKEITKTETSNFDIQKRITEEIAAGAKAMLRANPGNFALGPLGFALSTAAAGAGGDVQGLAPHRAGPMYGRLEDVPTASADEIAAFSDATEGSITVIHDLKDDLTDWGTSLTRNLSSTDRWTHAIDTSIDHLETSFSAQKLAGILEGLANAVVAGHGAKAAGEQVLSVVGGVADAATGGASGGLFAGLGAILGGIFGDSLDKLVASLGMLTPLFDTVGDLIGALTPVLIPLKIVLEAVRTAVDIGVVQPFKSITGMVGKFSMIFAEMYRAAAPWAGLMIDMVLSIFTIRPVWDLLAVGLGALANWVEGVAMASEHLYDAFVDVNNALVAWVRSIDIFGVKPFADFGQTLDHLAPAVDHNTKAIKANTQALNNAFQNLDMYKLAGAIAGADAGYAPGGVGSKNPNHHGGGHGGPHHAKHVHHHHEVHIHGPVHVGGNPSTMKALREEIMRATGNNRGLMANDDDDQN